MQNKDIVGLIVSLIYINFQWLIKYERQWMRARGYIIYDSGEKGYPIQVF